MTKEEIQAKFSRLPEAVHDHLYSEIIGELNGIIIDGNDISDTQRPVLFGLVKELIIGIVPLASVESEVKTRFGFDSAKSRKVALEILGYRLLPLDGFLGDVSAAIRALGGDPANYPTDRVELPAKEPAPVITVAMTLDTHLKERYQSIAESFAHGVRTEPQTLELLQKPYKTGGLELTEESAKAALAEIVVESKDHHDEVSEAPAPKSRIDAPTIEDEAEAAVFKESVLVTQEAEKSQETDDKIKASVDEIYAASGVFPADLALQSRLKKAIEGRLRDVRDSLETLETMVQPKELGGIALTQDDARKVLKLIDTKLRSVHEAHRQETESAKQGWLEAEVQKKTTTEAASQTKNATQLDSLYQAIVAKSSRALAKSSDKLGAAAAAVAAQTAPVVSRLPNPIQVDADPALAKPVPANLPVIAPVLRPPLPVPPVSAQLLAKTGGAGEGSPKRAQLLVSTFGEEPATGPVLAPARKSVLPTPPMAPTVMPRISSAPSPRPLMQDVKATPSIRLTGPVAELRDTAIIDFRRLSKDPIEACLKIKDKIDLLLHESYEKRTEGLRAWSESEVYRTYLDMMKEALEGNPLPQVMTNRQSAGKPVLTIGEVKAIADLSQKLRY